MKVRLTCLALAVVAAVAFVSADQSDGARTLMEAARKKEVVDGDLKGAIQQYQTIADRYKSDRAVVADALVRMADCYQKLGDGEARKIYERLVRDFADQRDAVSIARARLGSEPTAKVSKGDRAVWTGRDVDLFGTISPDGRYLTYVDWGGKQNVMLRDLVAGTTRALTNNTKLGEFGYPDFSVISRDGEEFVYGWQTLDRRFELRVASLRGSGVPASRRIRQFEADESAQAFDWSPDGKSLAVGITRADRSLQIGIVSVADGSFRPLKSVGWRGIGKMVFSPDGRFIAYDMLVGDARDRRHVYVLAVDASRETTVVDDASRNNLMGWSSDGHLVFVSDRTRTHSLWTVVVEDGRARGMPRLVKENVGSTWSLGLTPSGTLYVWQRASAEYVRVATVDLPSGRLVEPESITFQRFIESRGRPSWSADGKHLLYISCGPTGGGPCALHVRSTDTGSVREVPHGLGYLAFPRLAPDGHAIVTQGADLKGRRGIYLIDAKTGEASFLASLDSPARARQPEWSSDGRAILYMEDRDRDTVLMRWDIDSSKTSEVYRIDSGRIAGSAAPSTIGWIRISPDGGHVGFVRQEPERKVSTFVVAPLSGGAPRVLFESPGAFSLSSQHWQWLPDSQHVIVQKGASAAGDATPELWDVPVNGRARKLDIDMRQWREGFSVHPDGRHIAFAAQAGASGAEVWALENFLPKPATSSGSSAAPKR